MTRIALVGDYDPEITAHRAIPAALLLATARIGEDVQWDWIATASIQSAQSRFESYAAIWCVPGSPYRNTPGALAAIKYARETGRPFLGTCGGFQHALLEYAQAIWQLATPQHAELDPSAVDPVIAPLACSLIEASEQLTFSPGSRLERIYRKQPATEQYHCRYGLNSKYAALLETGPLKVAARDAAGSVRAVELDDHPFFVASLFQPERIALKGYVPPLVAAFVAASCACEDALDEDLVHFHGRGD